MIINGIDTKDISFVVQGAVDKDITPKCIESIRRNFPDSTIILSTWKGTKVDNCVFDVLVMSEDPGTCTYSLIPEYNNINRQLVSAVNGLSKVKTKYAAKVRSDLFFEDPSFLYYFNKFDKYDESYRIVKSRMVILSMYTRVIHYYNSHPFLANYHVSDWFMFGFTEDLKNYWSKENAINLAEFSRYYLERYDVNGQLPNPTLMGKNTPEQYFGSKFFKLTDSDIVGLSKGNQEESIKSIINNFVVIDRQYSKIYSLKWKDWSYNEWNLPFAWAVTLIFYGDFLRYYRRYCDKTYIVPGNIERETLKKKIAAVKNELWRNKVNRLIHEKIIDRCRNIIKRIIRAIFPAYRAATGVRERLMISDKVEFERFDYLIHRISKIEEGQNESRRQIRRIDAKLDIQDRSENDETE